jgi:S-disulfanyl-L-cysteine oxidoreductase SoxD
MQRRLIPLAIALAMLAIGATSPAPVSTLRGVYAESQAQAGAQLYAVRCAMCHGRLLEGTFDTPALQDKFIANWSKAPLSDLFDYIGRAMPQFAPGSLTPEDNAKIVAFLLKANGLPAGAQPLPAQSAALKSILLMPQPVVASGARSSGQ